MEVSRFMFCLWLDPNLSIGQSFGILLGQAKVLGLSSRNWSPSQAKVNLRFYICQGQGLNLGGGGGGGGKKKISLYSLMKHFGIEN